MLAIIIKTYNYKFVIKLVTYINIFISGQTATIDIIRFDEEPSKYLERAFNPDPILICTNHCGF